MGSYCGPVCFSGRSNYFPFHSYLVESWEHSGDKDLMNTYEKGSFKPLSSIVPLKFPFQNSEIFKGVNFRPLWIKRCVRRLWDESYVLNLDFQQLGGWMFCSHPESLRNNLSVVQGLCFYNSLITLKM
jgi:hypothetical protein